MSVSRVSERVPCLERARCFEGVARPVLRRLLLGSLLTMLPSPGGAGAAPATEGFVEVPQGRLWFDRHGAGPPLVLIHDGLLPSDTWEAQVGPLAAHFDVVRYDRRFYGRSTSETKDYQDDLLALLEHLGVAHATLVGCSSGGALAIDFALAQPGGPPCRHPDARRQP